MERIRILDTHTANRIAAGEVVERPASIVKELVENALDAGAKNIAIETQGGGTELIRVRDDGAGIPAEDVGAAFAPHGTSKIRTADDLEDIETLGFRGEALASIAAVSQVSMRTCVHGAEMGVCVRIEGGDIKENMPAGCPEGTLIEVANVFYNTPARLKFLKSPRTENAAIADYVARMLMAYTDVSFRLLQNGRTVYQSAGDGSLKNALFCVYGSEVLPHLRPLEYEDGYCKLTGFAGTEQISRNNRLAQSFYVNRRYIKSQKLSFAVQRAYDTRLMSGRFPFIVMNIAINGREVDVNVHPNKLDVRFKQEDRILHAAASAVRRALGVGEIPAALQKEVEQPQTTWFGRSADNEERRAQTRAQCAELSERMHAQQPTAAAPLREAAPAFLPRTEAPETTPVPSVSAQSDLPTITIAPRATAAAPCEAQMPLAFAETPYRVVGQLLGCYWVIEQGTDVFFIDQHAAHERKLYEEMMRAGIHADAQMLLAPEIVTLSPMEFDALEEVLPALAEMGFDIQEFGALTVSVRAVPHIIGKPQAAAFLHEALGLCAQRKGKPTTLELKRASLIQTACKHAVKAGQPLSETEIRALLDAFAQEGIPLTCPHGRPVMVRMTRTEFEKMFKRLV